MTQAIPEGFHSLQPHIVVQDAPAAIEFYKKAFGAVECFRMTAPGGIQVIHADLLIGDSHLMLAEAFETPTCATKSPVQLGGTPDALHLYVENADVTFKTAIEAGATELMAPADMFWGDRYGKLRDPFGHEWSIATRIRTLTAEEVQAGAEACFSQPQPAC